MKLNIEKILSEIDRLGWTKYRLAKEMGMKNQSVYKILNGKDDRNFTLKTVEKFAKALKVDPIELIS